MCVSNNRPAEFHTLLNKWMLSILTDSPTQYQVADALLSGISAGYEGVRGETQVEGGHIHFNFVFDEVEKVFKDPYNPL